ncbi:hypothetical protein KFU94_30880 [Chloroflexi bacterium TSY]|nr:hypothetical protein [Chloroflexi bacterium TSY]
MHCKLMTTNVLFVLLAMLTPPMTLGAARFQKTQTPVVTSYTYFNPRISGQARRNDIQAAVQRVGTRSPDGQRVRRMTSMVAPEEALVAVQNAGRALCGINKGIDGLTSESRCESVDRQITTSLYYERYVIQKSNRPMNGNHTTLTPFESTCTVNTLADSGLGSLRQCLLDAVPDITIDFDPQVFPPAAPVSITLASPLPWIITDTLTIDGSQAGVILDGSQLSEGSGLVIYSAMNVKVHGLQILHFPWDGITLTGGANHAVIGGDRMIGAAPLGQGNLLSGNGDTGVWLQDKDTRNNKIMGNNIGVNMSGTQPVGNGRFGVVVVSGASDNVIGGESEGARNLMSGNTRFGILLEEAETTGNRILGNFIGTDITGSQPLGNGEGGVVILGGASDNTVGGTNQGARNLISGNIGSGVWIQDANTTRNQVLGNYIGVDVTGNYAVANTRDGVTILGSGNNIVGGEIEGARNLISGNAISGVGLQYSDTTDNEIKGNFIGTNHNGTVALSNDEDGVFIGFGASRNAIGGETEQARNLISGNGRRGVWLKDSGTTGNQVLGNYIGTDITGTQALGNGAGGVVIVFKASNNVIGGDSPDARNLISGNGDAGVHIQDAGTADNRVLGNYIGTDAVGTSAIGNTETGVFIGFGASNNIIGGAAEGANNLISGNGEHGVNLQNNGTIGNRVLGNYIGIDATGTVTLGNLKVGVLISFGASHNIIGGETAGSGNLISGNVEHGVEIQNAGSTDNQVLGNFIGTDVTGRQKLGNRDDGVVIIDASNNVIGGPTERARNLISGNGSRGVLIQGSGSTSNQVLGNYIGADVTGTRRLGNGEHGLAIIWGANKNMVGGVTESARNLISGNDGDGVLIQRSG